MVRHHRAKGKRVMPPTDMRVPEVSARRISLKVVAELPAHHGTLGEEGHAVVVLLVPHEEAVPVDGLRVAEQHVV